MIFRAAGYVADAGTFGDRLGDDAVSAAGIESTILSNSSSLIIGIDTQFVRYFLCS